MSNAARPIDYESAEAAAHMLNMFWRARGYEIHAVVGAGAKVTSNLGPGGLPRNYNPMARLSLSVNAARANAKPDPLLQTGRP
jgi:hypothetical protein